MVSGICCKITQFGAGARVRVNRLAMGVDNLCNLGDVFRKVNCNLCMTFSKMPFAWHIFILTLSSLSCVALGKLLSELISSL